MREEIYVNYKNVPKAPRKRIFEFFAVIRLAQKYNLSQREIEIAIAHLNDKNRPISSRIFFHGWFMKVIPGIEKKTEDDVIEIRKLLKEYTRLELELEYLRMN